MVFIAINAFVIFGVSQLLTYLNTGADKSSMFHEDIKNTIYYTPNVHWEHLENPGRPMEIPTLKRIEKNYLDAWHTRYVALRTGNTAGIEDAYTEKARHNILEIVAHNTQNNIWIEGTSLAHNLTLDFYSADGKLIVLTDLHVQTHERTFQDDLLLLERDEISNYTVVMLLEDGFWRIRHLEKTDITIDTNTERILRPVIEPIAGINYYPQETPWDTFGDAFSSEKINADFKIINDLNLNTIRIFIGYEDFGKTEISAIKLERLNILLDLAQANNLQVVITLFDFYGNYDINDWSLTQAHARSIVGAVKNHPALSSWDVKNEPDLDFDSRNESLVKAWLQRTIKTIKEEDLKHAVTIGWSSPQAALNLLEKVDYVSFHYYQNLADLPDAITLLKGQTTKPIVLQEFGLSSNASWLYLLGNSEEDQASYYTSFFDENQKRESVNFLSWTLYDFTEIPDQVAGAYPWRKNKQSHFGLINNIGERKKAYFIIQNRLGSN